MADPTPYLLSLALGKEIADKTEKLQPINPGSKQDQAARAASKRGTVNRPGRS